MTSGVEKTGLEFVAPGLNQFLTGLDKVDRAVDKMIDGFGEVPKSTAKATKGVDDFLKSVLAGVTAILSADVIGKISGQFLDAGAAVFDFSSDVKQANLDIQARLGTTAERADELGDIAQKVWRNAFGTDVLDAANAVSIIEARMKVLGGVSDEELQDATENAFRLKDAFGVDVKESVNAAAVLMEKFGLSQQQAFDFIAKGFQNGLNSSDDFLDSINEYSVQFAEMGADAGQFFSAMETGIQGGVLGTDKIADLFKETRLRIGEETDATRLALGQIGIDADTFYAGLRDGSTTSLEAFSQIQSALGLIEDPVLQNTAAIALMGTQWEDLGADAVLATDITKTSLEDMAGATDLINAKYENWPSMWEGVKRSAIVALSPISDKLLSVAQEALPLVQDGLTWLEEELPPMVDVAVESIDEFLGAIDQILTDLEPITTFISENMMPIIAGVSAMLLYVGVPALITFGATAVTTAAGIITAWLPVIAPIAAIGVAVGVLYAAWEADFGGIKTTLTNFWTQTGKPIFDQLYTWLEQNIPVAIETVSSFFTDTLWPALQKVWQFIDTYIIPIVSALANVWFALLKKEIELLSALWTNVLYPGIQKVADFIDDNVVPAVDNAITAMDSAGRVIRDTLGPAFEWLDNNVLKPVTASFGHIEDAVNDVIGFLNRLASSINEIEIPSWLQGHSPPPLADWFSYIGESVDTATQQLPDFQNALAEVGDTIQEESSRSFSVFGQQLRQAGTRVTDTSDTISSSLQTMMDDLTRAFTKSDAPEDAEDLGVNILDSLAEGVANTITDAVDAAEDAAKMILETVQDVFEVDSPSKVMQRMGGYIGGPFVQSIVDTMDEGQPDLVNALLRITDAVYNAAADLQDGVGETLDTTAGLFDYTMELFEEQIPAFQNIMDGLIEAMRQSVAEQGDEAVEQMEDTIDKMVDAAEKLPDLIAAATQGIFGAQAGMARTRESYLAEIGNFSGGAQDQIMREIQAAEAEAAKITDPTERDDFLNLRYKQITEMGRLLQELYDAGADALDDEYKLAKKNMDDLAKQRQALSNQQQALDEKQAKAYQKYQDDLNKSLASDTTKVNALNQKLAKETDEERRKDILKQIDDIHAAGMERRAGIEAEFKATSDLTLLESQRIRDQLVGIDQAEAAERQRHESAISQIQDEAQQERARYEQRIKLIREAQAAEMAALKARQEQEQTNLEKLQQQMQAFMAALNIDTATDAQFSIIKTLYDQVAALLATAGLTVPPLLPRPANVGGNARGTDDWRGGPTWVGEEGPELLWLPMHSRIWPNRESEMLSQFMGMGSHSPVATPSQIMSSTMTNSGNVTYAPQFNLGITSNNSPNAAAQSFAMMQSMYAER
jgi:phage-related minor tail protein